MTRSEMIEEAARRIIGPIGLQFMRDRKEIWISPACRKAICEEFQRLVEQRSFNWPPYGLP